MLYRVTVKATHRATGQRQECDRSLIADHPQQAQATALQLLGVNGTDWEIAQCEARPIGPGAAAGSEAEPGRVLAASKNPQH